MLKTETFAKQKFGSGRIIGSVLWNFSGQLWIAVLSFFATPFIVSRLDVNLYGIYGLVGITVGYFSFLHMGMGNAAVKYMAQYLAVTDEEKIRKVYWASLSSSFLLGSAGMVVIIFFSRLIAGKFFHIEPEFLETAVSAIRLGSLGFLFSLLLGAVNSIIQAEGRFDTLNRVGIFMNTLQVFLAIILLKSGFSLKGVIFSGIFVQVTGFFIYFLIVRKKMPSLCFPVVDIHTVKQLFKFGAFISVSSLVAPFLLNIEKIFLTSVNSLSKLTYYLIPFLLVDRLSLVRSSVSSVLFPSFSYFNDAVDKEKNANLHYQGVICIVFLYVFFISFFIIFARPFLAAWLGNDFVLQSADILIILSFGGVINAMAAPSLAALQGMGKPHLPAFFHIIEMVLYIPLSYILILKFAGLGAAWAWVLRVSADTFLLHNAICRFFNISIFTWYGRIIFKVFLPASLCVILFFLISRLDLPFLSAANLGGVALVFVVYIVVVWRYGLDDVLKEKILLFIKENAKNY
ncbi:MAG: oligosaccharide flippase family protein [bacterium]